MGDAAIVQASSCRRAAVGLLKLTDKMVLKNKIPEAVGILDECSRMEMGIALSEPHFTTNYLLGVDAFKGTAERLVRLLPMLKDTKKATEYKKLGKTLIQGSKTVGTLMHSHDEQQEIAQTLLERYSIPGATAVGITISIVIAALASVWYLIWAAAVRAKKQKQIVIAPWGEGWLARLCIRVYLPTFVLIGIFIGVASRSNGPIAKNYDILTMSYAVPIALIIFAQMIVLTRVIGTIRKSLAKATEERIGTVGVLFAGPANRLAWSARQTVGAFGVHTAFLAGILFLSIIIYKPLFGNEPWETTKTQFSFAKDQHIVMDETAAELLKAIPPSWNQSK
jgi:hypothetical protein